MAIKNINFGRKTRSDAEKSKRMVICLRKIKNSEKTPSFNKQNIFDLAGLQDISKTTCNKFLKTIFYVTKPVKNLS